MRLGLALTIAAFALPAVRSVVGRLAVRGVERAGVVARWPKSGRAVIAIALGAGLLALLWILRQRNLELGDSALLTQLLTMYVHVDGFVVTYDEPLDLYLHSIAYRTLHAAFGWPVENAYAVLSCGAGLGYLVVMIVLWRRLASNALRAACGVALMASTAAVQFFFGYVENYTLVTLGLMVYVWLASRTLDGRAPLVAPAAALGVSMSLHVLAGWLLPSLLFLGWARSGRGVLPVSGVFSAAPS